MTGDGRTLVLLSLPQACALCDGSGAMGLAQLLGFPAAGRIRCPHCNPEPGRAPVPIRVFPMRDDMNMRSA